MKKIILITAIAIVVGLGFFGYTRTRQSTNIPDEWNKFADEVNGWEIEYPKTITQISLADDIGPKAWTNNIIFYNKDNWVLSVYATKTEFTNVENYLNAVENSYIQTRGSVTVNNIEFTVGLDPEIPTDQIFLTIQNKKIFVLHMNAGAPSQKILESFKNFE
ncbi:MAG TPA: hypothetical protein VK145_00885 [Candidatus Nanoarchaeia archaeon]|nr:hypothetical protein [Candidatus Nanoarchaeia archaeon]